MRSGVFTPIPSVAGGTLAESHGIEGTKFIACGTGIGGGPQCCHKALPGMPLDSWTGRYIVQVRTRTCKLLLCIADIVFVSSEFA